MAKHDCGTCKFRAIYDRNPRSIWGRLWRWHAGFCPGWKKYMISLPVKERLELAQRYHMKKFMTNE